MKLYSTPYCPFSQRTKIGLKVRQIPSHDIEIVNIDLANPPEELLAINPHGSTPTLELTKGEGFNESLVINEYLDTLLAPGPKLFGNNAAEVAKTWVHIENIGSRFTSKLQKVIFTRGNEVQFRMACRELHQAYSYLDQQLELAFQAHTTRGLLSHHTHGNFFGGHTFNAVDAAIAPFIVRLFATVEMRHEIPLPLHEQRTKKYFHDVMTHELVTTTSAPFGELVESMKKYVLPDEAVLKVKNASRKLLINLTSELRALNESLPKEGPGRIVSVSEPVWSLGTTERGNHIEAKFECASYEGALFAMNTLCEIQESADHHTSTRLDNFQILHVTICTHEPKWGVSEKDVALAKAISDKLLKWE